MAKGNRRWKRLAEGMFDIASIAKAAAKSVEAERSASPASFGLAEHYKGQRAYESLAMAFSEARFDAGKMEYRAKRREREARRGKAVTV